MGTSDNLNPLFIRPRRFGKEHVYCPWSLINYCDKAKYKHDTEPKAFWVNTSGNDIINLYIKNSMEAHDAENIDKLQSLLDGKSVEITLSEFTTYPDLSHNLSFDTFMTLMLHTGYVTYSEDSEFFDHIKIRIPNREVYECFKAKQKLLFGRDNPYWINQVRTLVDYLMENEIKPAEELMNSMLMQFLTFRNSGSELYYHGFVLGSIGLIGSTHGIKTLEEHEEQQDYSDMILRKNATDTVVILEFKSVKNARGRRKALISGAEKALEQIINKQYAKNYLEDGYSRVFGIGIGFGSKECVIRSLGNLALSS